MCEGRVLGTAVCGTGVDQAVDWICCEQAAKVAEVVIGGVAARDVEVCAAASWDKGLPPLSVGVTGDVDDVPRTSTRDALVLLLSGAIAVVVVGTIGGIGAWVLASSVAI